MVHGVHRADDVVELARLEQLGDPLLRAGHPVGLDPELQRRRADELAVGVEVVGRLLDPERVPPDVERLAEAVNVLGDPELLDPRLRGGLEVAVDVLAREPAPLRRRRVAVGAQVQVVVGQHGR